MCPLPQTICSTQLPLSSLTVDRESDPNCSTNCWISSMSPYLQDSRSSSLSSTEGTRTVVDMEDLVKKIMTKFLSIRGNSNFDVFWTRNRNFKFRNSLTMRHCHSRSPLSEQISSLELLENIFPGSVNVRRISLDDLAPVNRDV